MTTLLGIIAVLAVSGWLAVTIFQRFRRQKYPMAWKVAAIVLSIGGLALGVWLLTREQLASPTVRLAGYPFPVGGYEYIGGRWQGSFVSQFGFLAVAANMAVGIGICLMPFRIAQFIFERGITRELRLP